MRMTIFLAGIAAICASASCAAIGLYECSEPVPEAALAGRSDEEVRAIRRIERLGGRITIDDKKPDMPVVTINCLMGRVGDAEIKLFKYFPRLRTVVLSGNRITDVGLDYLADLPQVEELMFESVPVTSKGLASLTKLPRLKLLSLSWTKVDQAGLEQIEKLQNLEELDVDVPLGDEELRHVGKLTKLRKLHQPFWSCLGGINFEGMDLELVDGGAIGHVRLKTQVTDEGLRHLEGLTSLEDLNLFSSQFTDTGLKSLAMCKSLRRLELAGSQVTDEGLASLQSLTSLEYLGLANTRVQGAGLSHLSCLPKLRSLCLGGFQTTLTHDGICHLAKIEQLRELELRGRSITDNHVDLIAVMPHLQKLILDETKVSDAGLAHAARLPELQNISIRNSSGVTAGGVEELKASRPSLSVEYWPVQSARRASVVDGWLR